MRITTIRAQWARQPIYINVSQNMNKSRSTFCNLPSDVAEVFNQTCRACAIHSSSFKVKPDGDKARVNCQLSCSLPL